jgi:hypothetical protein
MEIVHLQIKDGGSAGEKRISTTAGLTSGYQRTASSSSGVSAIETTGGLLLIEISTLPWYSSLPLNELNLEIGPDLRCNLDELSAGYQAMSIENSRFAEDSLPLALEVWPSWEN